MGGFWLKGKGIKVEEVGDRGFCRSLVMAGARGQKRPVGLIECHGISECGVVWRNGATLSGEGGLATGGE